MLGRDCKKWKSLRFFDENRYRYQWKFEYQRFRIATLVKLAADKENDNRGRKIILFDDS